MRKLTWKGKVGVAGLGVAILLGALVGTYFGKFACKTI